MTDIANVAAQVAPRRLPFSFAKRYGVVVAYTANEDTPEAVVHARESVRECFRLVRSPSGIRDTLYLATPS